MVKLAGAVPYPTTLTLPYMIQAYADYTDMMALTEELVRACALEVTGGLQLAYQGQELDLAPPFRRATMHALVQEATGAAARPPSAAPAHTPRIPVPPPACCAPPCCKPLHPEESKHRSPAAASAYVPSCMGHRAAASGV